MCVRLSLPCYGEKAQRNLSGKGAFARVMDISNSNLRRSSKVSFSVTCNIFCINLHVPLTPHQNFTALPPFFLSEQASLLESERFAPAFGNRIILEALRHGPGVPGANAAFVKRTMAHGICLDMYQAILALK